MFAKNEAREALYEQYQQVTTLLNAAFDRRMDAIRSGNEQVSLLTALEIDVLMSKQEMLITQYTGNSDAVVTLRLSWYDSRGGSVPTDYNDWLNETVDNGLPRWLADLNTSLVSLAA